MFAGHQFAGVGYRLAHAQADDTEVGGQRGGS
jgi:hypothetical protein